MKYKCNVCGNEDNNSPYVIREMMFGLRHEFTYIQCAKCGCLQIARIPEDMDVYYPDSYYSFQQTGTGNKHKSLKSRFADYLMTRSIRCQVGKINLIGWLARLYKPQYYKESYSWLNKEIGNLESNILDVGCGSGELLQILRKSGFKKLTGVDPYVKSDMFYDDGLLIYKKDVFDLEDKYDLIMLHHSFEHMAEPCKIMAKLKTLLADNGTLLIRIPLVDSYVWRKYGIDWFEIDAPRHFFLHTVKSMNYLSEKNEFVINRIFYDSLYHQFTISEKYIRNYTFVDDITFFSSKEINSFKKMSKQLNTLCDGDRACFYLKSNKANQINPLNE